MAGLLTDLIYSYSFEFISIIEETNKYVIVANKKKSNVKYRYSLDVVIIVNS
jgi:hypothetical protein